MQRFDCRVASMSVIVAGGESIRGESDVAASPAELRRHVDDLRLRASALTRRLIVRSFARARESDERRDRCR